MKRVIYAYIWLSACLTFTANITALDFGSIWLWLILSPLSFILAAFFPYPFSYGYIIELIISAGIVSGVVWSIFKLSDLLKR